MSIGSVCNSTQPPVESVFELEARPVRNGDRCLLHQLEGQRGICLPTICTNREMSPESTRRESNSCFSSTNMECSSVVPRPSGAFDQRPTTPSQERGLAHRPIQQIPPNGRSAISRLESVRRQHNDMGVSERSSKLIAAGWSTGTNTAYQSAWKRWCGWCAERKIDPLSCGVQPFLDFLADLFEQGLQHRTINLIRSAISMTHQQVEGIPIGQHPLVTRLIKGVHNSRPPKPRYTVTWDVDIVLRHLRALGDNDHLSLRALSKKLALLMALTDASRTSELQALDLRFRRFRPEGVYFTLAALTKKRKVGAPAKELFFGAFPQDHTLCVVQCLRQYEKVTKDIRPKDRAESNPLFLSYIKPHRPVTSQRIAHWIKDLLGEAGVDTDTFKAHSVRGASTTAALAKGVSLQDILRTADWSAESTFQRFYYRPEKENVYARTLLNLEDKESGEPKGTYVPSGRFGLYAILVMYIYLCLAWMCHGDHQIIRLMWQKALCH